MDLENLEMKVTCFFKMLVTTYPVTGITFRRLESLISLLWKLHNWYRYDHFVAITTASQLQFFPPTCIISFSLLVFTHCQ